METACARVPLSAPGRVFPYEHGGFLSFVRFAVKEFAEYRVKGSVF